MYAIITNSIITYINVETGLKWRLLKTHLYRYCVDSWSGGTQPILNPVHRFCSTNFTRVQCQTHHASMRFCIQIPTGVNDIKVEMHGLVMFTLFSGLIFPYMFSSVFNPFSFDRKRSKDLHSHGCYSIVSKCQNENVKKLDCAVCQRNTTALLKRLHFGSALKTITGFHCLGLDRVRKYIKTDVFMNENLYEWTGRLPIRTCLNSLHLL